MLPYMLVRNVIAAKTFLLVVTAQITSPDRIQVYKLQILPSVLEKYKINYNTQTIDDNKAHFATVCTPQ